MNYLFFLISYFLIWTGFLDFCLWPQIFDLYNSEDAEKGFLDLILTHPHGLRYTLTYPIIFAGNWLGVSYSNVFTALSPVILILAPIFLSKTVLFYKRDVSVNNKKILFLFLSLTVVSIAHFMNGRMLFALSGFSVLIYCIVYFEILLKKYIVILAFLSLLFMSVSSGAFVVGLISTAFIVFYSFFRRPTKGGFVMIFLSLAGFAYLLPLISMLIMKNIDYYGSVYLMLNHGYGKFAFIASSEVLWVLLLIFTLITSVLIYFINSYKKYIPLLFVFLVPIVIGMFGNSVLALSIIPFLALFSVFVLPINKSKLEI